MAAQARWNPPPGWPIPPAGWSPPPGWRPPPGWPPPPAGWQWCVPEVGRISRGPRIVVGIGAALLGLSPFLPWIRVVLLGDLSLFDLFVSSGHSPLVVWLLVVAAIGLVVLASAVRPAPVLRVVVNLVGAGASVIVVLLTVGALRGVGQASGFAGLGPGPVLAIAGAVTTLVAGNLVGR